MMLERLMLAILVNVSLLACVAAGGEKKLIRFGIDSPDTVWMRDNIAEMKQTPFDGTVFYMTTDEARAQGAVGDFSWGAFGATKYSAEQIQTGIDALKSTKFDAFNKNFMRLSVTGSNDLSNKQFVDWFDSFDVILHNMKLAASAAKEGGVPGIMFDIEAYAGPLWDYKQQRDAGTKSFDEYAAQVRRRGAEVMQAFQSAYPDITIILIEGYTLPYRDAWPWPYKEGPNNFPVNSGSKEKLKYIPYGLLAPFLDGIIETAAPTVKLIDGGEGTYTHRTVQEFATFRKAFERGVLPMVGVPDKMYHDRMDLALATWVDVNWRQEGGWNPADFTNNFWQPAELQEALENALKTSDEYVWLYAESLRFWGPGKNVPDAYWQAIVAARGSASKQ